jgi:hypothetical protein
MSNTRRIPATARTIITNGAWVETHVTQTVGGDDHGTLDPTELLVTLVDCGALPDLYLGVVDRLYVESVETGHWALTDPNDPILGRIAEVCIHWPDDEPESLRA